MAAIHPTTSDQFVEIGPGHGALTYPLLAQDVTLDVIEIDRDLIEKLKEKTQHTKLVIHEQDALKVDFAELFKDKKKIRILGNLPYNISTPLLFHILQFGAIIEDMHFMLQKEVVDRITAHPGTHEYGRLSVMVQSLCQAWPLFEVPKEAFRPAPKVTSKIIRLVPYHDKNPYPYKNPYPLVDRKVLQKVVTTAFSYRRKTLRNALSEYMSKEDLIKLGLDPNARPETLTVLDYIRLANYLAFAIENGKDYI